MNRINQKLSDIIAISAPIFNHFHWVQHVQIFGSFAKGNDREDSDIDFLLTCVPNSKPNVMDFVLLVMELEENLKRNVDVVDVKDVNRESFKKSIEETRLISVL